MPEPRLDENARTAQATALMTAFAERTGLTGGTPPVRYLWTDAFAVCNFVGLERIWKDGKFLNLGRRLIKQVHETLGRHRSDDARSGWISGLPDDEGKLHPTRGGLRIGKRLPERRPKEPFDEYLEWEREGQYFHYLTQWAHALDVMARQTKAPQYAEWAKELVEAAARAFVYENPAGQRQMCWKMSIDLSRRLITAMGHLDPLEGYITTRQILATCREIKTPAPSSAPDHVLDSGGALEDFTKIMCGRNWTTSDPLGLGGLLLADIRLMQVSKPDSSKDLALISDILQSVLAGIRIWVSSDALNQPANRRLAFRELGLAIGIEGLQWVGDKAPAHAGVQNHLDALSQYAPIAEQIISFWAAPENQQNPTWTEHIDINSVMLATALRPQGYLKLQGVSNKT